MAQMELIAKMGQSAKGKGVALWQMSQARKMKEALGEQPLYQTPAALTEGYDAAEGAIKEGYGGALSSAQQRSIEGLPYAIRKNFEERMGQQQAAGLEFAGKRARGLAGIRDIAMAGQQGSNDLLSAEAAAKLAAQQDVEGIQMGQADSLSSLNQAKGTAIGAEQEKSFFLNEYNPFMQAKGELAAMQGAALQNLSGKSGAEAMANYGVSQQENQAASA